MRNAKMTIWAMVVVLVVFYLGPPKAKATVIFDDGQTHNIDKLIGDHVKVYDDAFFDRFTTVNLLPGGSITGSLGAYDRSHVSVSGGSIRYSLASQDYTWINISAGSMFDGLWASGNTQVTISGGSIGQPHYGLNASDSAQVTITGGLILGYLYASGNTQIAMSGGSIAAHLRASGNSQVTFSGGTIGETIYAGSGYLPDACITFIGTDFAINGTPVGYGEFDTRGHDSIHGTLTGTLASGDYLNNEFYIYGDSSIVLIPEPATLILLVLGGVMLRRKKHGLKI